MNNVAFLEFQFLQKTDTGDGGGNISIEMELFG